MDYKTKLLIPILAANSALIVYLMLAWAPEYAADPAEASTQLLPQLLLWLLASAAIVWAVMVYLGYRLRSLARHAQSIAQGDASAFPLVGNEGDDFGRCATQMDKLHVLLRQRQAALERESNLLQQCEQHLRESEELYIIAIRNASDGSMEWDLIENRMLYSPRWKGMLGLESMVLGDNVEEWYSRMHQDDYARTRNAVQLLLDGKVSMFENEHRLRHGSGEYLWVAARGVVVRSAGGKPVKFIGTLTDITEKKLAQQLLNEVEKGLETVTGEEFFRMLVRNMGRALNAKYSFITECLDGPDGKPDRVRTIAFWAEGGFADNIEYELAGTPCQEVINAGISCFYPMGLAQRFPKEAGMESYVGIAVIGENGKVVGHLACLDAAPVRNNLPIQSIQKLFAMRASAEIVRMSLEKSLQVARRINRVLCDNMDELVLLADATGRLETINGAAERFCNLQVADIPGYPLKRLLAPANAAIQNSPDTLQALINGSGAPNQRYCLLNRQGQVHEVQGMVSPIYNAQHRLEKILVVARPAS